MKLLLIILAVGCLTLNSLSIIAKTNHTTQSDVKQIEYAGAKGRPAATPKPNKTQASAKTIKTKVKQGTKKVAQGTKKVMQAAKKVGTKIKSMVSKGKGVKQTKSAGGKRTSQPSSMSNNKQHHTYQPSPPSPKHPQATWKEKGYLDNAYKRALSRTQEDLDRAAKNKTTTKTDKVEKNHDLKKPPIDYKF